MKNTKRNKLASRQMVNMREIIRRMKAAPRKITIDPIIEKKLAHLANS